jgi:exopolysaccharide production protein ExoQ
MPPTLALLIWLILLLVLLYFDPARVPQTSLALWVPLIWLCIIGSRLPSQWLGVQLGVAAQAMEEGNPLDRTVDLVLILLAITILISRSFSWSGFFARNVTLVAFLCFALISVVWSDFPFIALKRWIRDFGNYLVILVALSDPHPLEAVRTLLRRLSYLLIPLSILLNKYYPGLSKQYDQWSGNAMFVGATTSKNMLGVLCLISGIFFFWDTLTRWPERKEWRTKKILVLNAAFMAMTLWLLNLSHSATSSVCLAIGCLVIVAFHSRWGKRRPTFLKVLIPATFCLYLILAFGFDMNAELASQVGRDPTLTDRSLIWKTVLSLHTNPLVGTGYESFWLGPRLERVWQEVGHINEAHNGYIEVYLNLGLIGVFLVAGLLISSYRTIWRRLGSLPSLALLNLALWTTMLFYNMTEAAFKSGLMWAIFLLGALAVPERTEATYIASPQASDAGTSGRFFGPPIEAARQRRQSLFRSSGQQKKALKYTLNVCEKP